MPAFTETYDTIKSLAPRNWRSRGRDIALDILSRGMKKTIGFEKYLRKPRIQFLYIHHVFSDEEKGLVNLLSELSRHHHFISYTEAWSRLLKGEIDKPYIAFSSDDGLKNNLKAASILQDFGASACFFVCPSMIGETDFNTIKTFSAERLHFPPIEFMNWDDIEKLQKNGHEIGSHTMRHINMAETNKTDLLKEIADSKNILEEKCGKILHFAYPYGRHFHFSSAGRKIVFDQGFKSCASAERGCHITEQGGIKDPAQLLIRRDHVILDWPVDHILYFLARNSMNASPLHNSFPAYADSHPNQ